MSEDAAAARSEAASSVLPSMPAKSLVARTLSSSSSLGLTLPTHHVNVYAELNVLAIIGQHATGEFVLLVDRRHAHQSRPVNLIADIEDLAARQVERTGRADHGLR
jgi:hypothetical protein